MAQPRRLVSLAPHDRRSPHRSPASRSSSGSPPADPFLLRQGARPAWPAASVATSTSTRSSSASASSSSRWPAAPACSPISPPGCSCPTIPSPARRPPTAAARRRSRAPSVLALAAIVLLGHGLFFLAPPLIGLGLIAVVGVLLWRAAGGTENPGSTAAKFGLGLLLLVVAAVGFVAVAVGSALGGGAAIAGLVIALGVALVVSSFLGGRRWLVLPALILAIPLGFAAAAGFDVHGGVGDRDYQPTHRGRSPARLQARHRPDAPRPDPGRPARRPHAAEARHGHRQRAHGRARRRLRRLQGARRRRLRPRARPRQRRPRRRLAPEPDPEQRRQAAGDRRRRRHRRAAGGQQPVGDRHLGPALPLRPEVQLRRGRPVRPAAEQQRQRRLLPGPHDARASIPPRSSPGS